jgi:cytoskeletal protein RodZ
MIDLEEKEKMWIVKLIGVGFVVLIGIVVLYNYLRNNEYPELSNSDLITNQWVNSVDIERGLCFVELQNGLKFRVSGQNLNYEDYTSISDILNSKVLFSKNANSDTVTIRYLDKDYKYVNGQVIKKKM